jgi:hypothetical protein
MESAFIENVLALMTMWIEYWVKHLDRDGAIALLFLSELQRFQYQQG